MVGIRKETAGTLGEPLSGAGDRTPNRTESGREKRKYSPLAGQEIQSSLCDGLEESGRRRRRIHNAKGERDDGQIGKKKE